MDPFAQALQSNSKSRPQRKAPALSPELEKNFSSSKDNTNKLNPFSEALARTGGTNFDGIDPNNLSQGDLEKQKLDLEKKQKKEALRLKLHKEINPVDLHDLYTAEAKKTQKALDRTRQELKAEFKQFKKESGQLQVEIALFNEVVVQGREGIGFREYLDKIRQFIRVLRKQVHSTRTWMQTQNAKSKKKNKGRGKSQKGIEVSGQKHEQTKAVFDQMHHEQSATYSGN